VACAQQVRVLAIGDAQNAYAQNIVDELRRAGVRAEIDISGDKIGGKIRNAELAKVHTMFIVGQKEQDADKIAVRVHGKGDQGAQPRAATIAQILSDIKSRKL